MTPSLRSAPALLAALLGAVSCGGGDLVLPGDVGPPADLLLVSGDEQEAAAGGQLAEPIVVRLVDANGIGIPAESVTWVVGLGAGNIAPGDVETTADGLARASWTLGPTPGANTVSAVAAGVAVVTFTASATGSGGGGGGGNGPPDRLAFRIEPADVEADERIRPAVIVAVVDAAGAIVGDAEVRVELTLAAGPGELEGERSVETKHGIAIFDDLELDEAGSGYVLRATVPGDAGVAAADSRAFTVEEEGD